MSTTSNINSVQLDFTLVLPQEISREIFSDLSIPDLGSVAQVNKQWNKLSANNLLWLQIGKSLQIPNFTDKDCKTQVKTFLDQVVTSEEELIERITSFYMEQNPKNTSFALKYISDSGPQSQLYAFKIKDEPTDTICTMEEIFTRSEANKTIIGKGGADFGGSWNSRKCVRWENDNKIEIDILGIQEQLYTNVRKIFGFENEPLY